MGEQKTEDLWRSYRDLHDTVNKYLTSDDLSPQESNELENILRKNKQCFYSLLQNLPKSAKAREELKKGVEDGIAIKGVGQQVLSRELYQETVIISDMFELNEYVALDLLCTAQLNMSYYPGNPRGLVAVTMYYAARKYLVNTLRMLIQARSGVTWTVNLPHYTLKFINAFTDQLLENGIINRIFDLLKTLDLSKEIEKLQANLALGDAKHRRDINDTFMAIKCGLAECVYLWAGQSGLNKQMTVQLLNHLKDVKFETEASGKLDNVTFYLIMAVLYALDLSVLHTREDGEELVKKLPILSEDDYVNAILKELSPTQPKWATEGLQAISTFAFAVSLSSLRIIPQGQQVQNALDYEDEYVDAAIIMNVFDFITYYMMENDLFYLEEIIYRRMHNLFCDFIVQMYPKVKELRIKADETSRTIQAYLHEGLELPANMPRYFESLLKAITKMYSKDPIKLQLMLDYWCPSDVAQNQTYYRANPRSVSLFKFVRLAGDMLPPSLFVHYVNMLASLSGCQQAARHCFNLLKQPSGYTSTLTWDHFFNSFSQYYSNLKQEIPSGSETIYRHSRTYYKGITPQEIEGLQAVLHLIKAVSDNDDFTRIAICEHPGWEPLAVLLGLVSCSIPIPLKADLLLTLSSLCKTQEGTVQTWNNLEASQILVTVPTTSSYQPRGIQTELDEVESRLEYYPLIRAWLRLIDSLTEMGIPRTLGAGSRQPGFDPYLTFIINSVFLKFNNRSYKDPTEKWQVAASCLKLFSKFLTQYEPDIADFPNQHTPNEFNSPPGFHLMIQLHSKTELFNAMLYIINEGNRLYDLCTQFSEEKYIDECTVHVLVIIERCLKLQGKFFSLLSASNCPILLTNMNKLLLTINPQSGRPDHILNIMKYTCYQRYLAKQTLLAVRITTLLTASPLTHSNLMTIILSATDIDKVILAGFVDCLDEGLDEENNIMILIKKAIFALFQQCLPYSSPNLSHFLLGFDLKKGVSKTVFHVPGIVECARTCMHSMLMLLRQILSGVIEEHHTSLVESIYHMLYILCANPRTAEPVLKFMRVNLNFFKDHINYCFNHYNNGVSELNQLSWILKTLAIEIRLSCTNKQIVNLKQLSQILVGIPVDPSPPSDSFSLIQKAVEPVIDDTAMNIENLKQDNFLVKLITDFNFHLEEVATPQWGFFDNASLESYLASCQTEGSPKLIDIRRLHKNLIEEVTSAQGAGALGQRQAIMEEIQKVLLYAVNINNNRKVTSSIVKFVDAWRQVTQVFVTFLPNEIITAKEQSLLEIYLLENILHKCVKTELLPEVANHFSATVLILLENLRKNYLKEELHNKTYSKDKEVTASMVELNMTSMKAILNYIIEWIIQSDNKSQRMRINLYGSLATFLQLINLIEKSSSARSANDSLYVSTLDSNKFRIQDEITSVYVSSNILSSFGEKLIEVLCYDCMGGQEVCKMLAMSCFSLLVDLSGNVNWISYMCARGYLNDIIESILKSDNELRSALEPAIDNIKVIFLYDAKMSFFAKIASTKIGAEILLEQRVLSVLASMKVFDFHPEFPKNVQVEDGDTFEMSAESRYLQIWEPTLYLCNAMLTSLGTDHRAVIVQIISYLISHLDVVELILRSGSPNLPSQLLRELSLLTSIVARTADNNLISFMDATEVTYESRSHLYRLQKLMLGLMPRFVLTDATVRELLCDPNNDHNSYQTSTRLTHSMEVAANLMLYCRNITENNGIDHDSVGVIFHPSLNESSIALNGIQKNKNYKEHTPSLGVVVEHLINNVNFYHKEKGTVNFLNRKISEIPELGTVDLKEFVITTQTHDINRMREEALEFISAKMKMKENNIKQCLFTIEHAMYIIWAHLDYYMLKTIPKTKNLTMQRSHNVSAHDTTLASAIEATWKVSTDDISCLKQGLVSIFNDSFCRQLLETSQGRSETDSGFLEVLLRKTKRLMQFVPVK